QPMLRTAVAMARRTLKALAARSDRFERDLRADAERDAVAEAVDHAGHLVTRLQAGRIADRAAIDVQVAAADADRADADAHPTRRRFRYLSLGARDRAASEKSRCFHRFDPRKKPGW